MSEDTLLIIYLDAIHDRLHSYLFSRVVQQYTCDVEGVNRPMQMMSHDTVHSELARNTSLLHSVSQGCGAIGPMMFRSDVDITIVG